MSKPALIELVNAALVTIGQEPIVTLENNESVSSTVTAVRAKVDLVKRELLRCNDWNCARVTTKLYELSNKKNTGWDHAYQLPTDPECLRVVQISVDGGGIYIDLDDYYNHNMGPMDSFFDIDGDILLCNAEEVYIKYTADIDPAKFDPTLATAFVYQLASELAYTLPASVSLADYMQRMAKSKLKIAKATNARERKKYRPEGDVIGIRYGYSDRCLRVDMSDELE